MKPGDKAPEFELSDQLGHPRKLSDLLADGPVALFFYPAAFTPGCTKEACHFRNLAAEFAEAGVQRIGISRDAVAKQQEWAAKHELGYPLLSDADGAVASAYGVRRDGLLKLAGMPTKRTTFAIRADGTVADVIASEVNMQVHADRALAALRN
ncbi:thioredoxin-dependent peroxiredoxin OS=Tsukamurella paurometabola (strain ATCC 8368 / DSM /CCUG 35730 / CIP 100753 / JCM 10117 / KCTC 9821 / NBRC 16120/ NCIMB 702349 / NCTC 13040) OX=521096 GN=Tpau_3093 PE=3 SV=1 [Tsukamurella paurometabola]|uniref:thioredoxin-dependent peroxiredoxin n=1 Tax=Tsukamurella paurometabola (strain ATCC 8368 / DSM 20162 / CCUG 35730 / CIP 100753 / JCM 10117 / KCTC 9821 / NBRC 16120 / NCIMB 702349 / NCTC 13040) TaxID=521096 RepID=D5UUW6_TSUPD|nr:peroxiredoxin [Tsukamurella paurometabola]ADG79684.1 alkyl hydroperoxide reductase/ Thiol specific antioxidant/ Mal allergen [Tsukamurella paurometabola DSM 20162]SUP36754.1 Putative peroxiredoxin bcp [Tsukamurella paurometabola]